MRAPRVSSRALPFAHVSPGLRLGGISSVAHGADEFGAIACSPGWCLSTVRHRTQRCHSYVALILGMLPAIAGATCDWSKPGSAPYRGPGDVTAATAVESYQDIPPAARADLAERIRGQREDAIVLITRDGLASPQGRASDLRDMHWKRGMCAGPVVRSGWAPERVEAALVYCSAGHCVAVPVICGNVARITFVPRLPTEPGFRGWDGKSKPVRTVPEPSTLLLALVAIPFIRWSIA